MRCATELIPLNRRWNLAALRQILLGIPWRHRETVTIAYLLLDGVNDTHADARRLAAWCRGLPAKINLLEFNPYPGSQFRRAGAEKLAAFRGWLRELGAFHTLRHSRGGDVLAACGQLAAGNRISKCRMQNVNLKLTFCGRKRTNYVLLVRLVQA